MTVSPLVLHHYDLSPFSEKVRTMLGYTGMHWYSVRTREMPPRPLLEPLAGGYRRIPVAQDGADVFCDTRVITSEIADRAGRAELAREGCSDEVRAFVRETDLEIFLACVTLSFGLRMNRNALRGLSWPDVARLLWDRVKMARGARIRPASGRQAKERVMEQLERLERMLGENDFLFGPSPCIADFSAWHGLWFMREVGARKEIEDCPLVVRWMDYLAGCGHGNSESIGADQALQLARETDPRPVADSAREHTDIGMLISIAPDDYARDPVVGELAGVTPWRWILRRETDQTGEVHLHFPREGFLVQRM